MLLCLRLCVFLIKDKTYNCGIKTYTEHHTATLVVTQALMICMPSALRLWVYIRIRQITHTHELL